MLATIDPLVDDVTSFTTAESPLGVSTRLTTMRSPGFIPRFVPEGEPLVVICPTLIGSMQFAFKKLLKLSIVIAAVHFVGVGKLVWLKSSLLKGLSGG
jgi:hypothetical protein